MEEITYSDDDVVGVRRNQYWCHGLEAPRDLLAATSSPAMRTSSVRGIGGGAGGVWGQAAAATAGVATQDHNDDLFCARPPASSSSCARHFSPSSSPSSSLSAPRRGCSLRKKNNSSGVGLGGRDRGGTAATTMGTTTGATMMPPPLPPRLPLESTTKWRLRAAEVGGLGRVAAAQNPDDGSAAARLRCGRERRDQKCCRRKPQRSPSRRASPSTTPSLPLLLLLGLAAGGFPPSRRLLPVGLVGAQPTAPPAGGGGGGVTAVQAAEDEVTEDEANATTFNPTPSPATLDPTFKPTSSPTITATPTAGPSSSPTLSATSDTTGRYEQDLIVTLNSAVFNETEQLIFQNLMASYTPEYGPGFEMGLSPSFINTTCVIENQGILGGPVPPPPEASPTPTPVAAPTSAPVASGGGPGPAPASAPGAVEEGSDGAGGGGGVDEEAEGGATTDEGIVRWLRGVGNKMRYTKHFTSSQRALQQKTLRLGYKMTWTSKHVMTDAYAADFVTFINANLTRITEDLARVGLVQVLDAQPVLTLQTTEEPTLAPTVAPTLAPTPAPSAKPTPAPTVSQHPSAAPSDHPSDLPSYSPSASPTHEPTNAETSLEERVYEQDLDVTVPAKFDEAEQAEFEYVYEGYTPEYSSNGRVTTTCEILDQRVLGASRRLSMLGGKLKNLLHFSSGQDALLQLGPGRRHRRQQESTPVWKLRILYRMNWASNYTDVEGYSGEFLNFINSNLARVTDDLQSAGLTQVNNTNDALPQLSTPRPSAAPTPVVTAEPTFVPSLAPTSPPTSPPTSGPTSLPSGSPTASSSAEPTKDPTSKPSSPRDTDPGARGTGLSTGAIAGIAAGSVAVLILFIVWLYRRRSHQKDSAFNRPPPGSGKGGGKGDRSQTGGGSRRDRREGGGGGGGGGGGAGRRGGDGHSRGGGPPPPHAFPPDHDLGVDVDVAMEQSGGYGGNGMAGGAGNAHAAAAAGAAAGAAAAAGGMYKYPPDRHEQSLVDDPDDLHDVDNDLPQDDSLVSNQSLISAGMSMSSDSGHEDDARDFLADEFDQIKDQNLEKMRTEVEGTVTNVDGMMSQALLKALMDDEDTNRDMHELTWGGSRTSIEIEASVLCEMNDWLKRKEGAGLDERRAFMQETLNKMVASVRHGIVEPEEASRTIHECAAMLGLQLAENIPETALIVTGMRKTVGTEEMIASFKEFGDIEGAAVSPNQRGFGLVRYRSPKSVLRAIDRFKTAEIVVQDVAVMIRVLKSEGGPIAHEVQYSNRQPAKGPDVGARSAAAGASRGGPNLETISYPGDSFGGPPPSANGRGGGYPRPGSDAGSARSGRSRASNRSRGQQSSRKGSGGESNGGSYRANRRGSRAN